MSASMVLAFVGCDNFNTARNPTKATVGAELFGVLCDRVVAQNFPEDIEGTRFDRLCHPGPDGRFGTPPETPAATLANPSAENTRLAYARVRALADRRTDLIKSFDVMFPEDEPGFLDGLKSLLADISPLYDREMPAMLKSADQVIVNIQQSEEAINGLTRILNREGYRPARTAAGLTAAFANQPEFATFLDASLRVLAPGGENEELLNQVLESANDTLKGVKTTGTIGSSLVSDALLAEDDSLFQAGEETYVAKRDACGAAAFNKDASIMTELQGSGTCQSMDAYGRFLDNNGAVMLLPTPFATFGPVRDTVRRDEWDRALDPSGKPIFQYFSVNKTPLAGILASSRDLFQPKLPIANDLLTNLGPAFGDLSATVSQNGATSRRYDIYSPDSAPLVDVAIALQPALKGLAENDFEALDVLSRAFKRNDVLGARLIVALARAKDLANADSQAVYDTKSTFWDEVMDLLTEIADTPPMVDPVTGEETTLLGEMLASFGHPAVADLPNVMQKLMLYNDEIDYDPDNINGAPINVTSGGSGFTHKNLVDRAQPDNDMNRSLFQRLSQIIHETHGVRYCNKQNPSFAGVPVTASECGFFDVKDMAVFFLQAMVVNGNAGESEALGGAGQFPITQAGIQALAAAGGAASLNIAGQLMAAQSGINGLTMYPTAEALSRALFSREPNSFLDGMQDPAPTAVCGYANYTGELYDVRKCANDNEKLRNRHRGTFLAFETSGFFNAIRPIARPFVKFHKESTFLRLKSAVTRAWPSKNNTDCEQTGAPDTNARFCTRSNMVTYEPLLAKIFSNQTDLLTSLHLFVKDIETNEPGKTKKLAPALRGLFSREANLGLSDRKGFATSRRNDGQDNNYVTPAHLIVKALDDIETKRKLDASAYAQYRKARSSLVDTLFAYDRDGDFVELTRLKNQAMAKVMPSFLKSMADELRARKKDGRLNELIGGGLVSDMKDLVGSPLLYSGLQTVKVLRQDATAEQAMLATVFGALNPENADVFMASAASVADLLQALNDTSSLRPLLPALAPAFLPVIDTSKNEPGAVKATIGLLAETAKLDADHRLTTVVKRAVSTMPSGTRTPMDIFSDTIAEVSRVDPSKDQPFTADDTRRLLAELRSFLGDDKNGFKRLINVIQKRNITATK